MWKESISFVAEMKINGFIRLFSVYVTRGNFGIQEAFKVRHRNIPGHVLYTCVLTRVQLSATLWTVARQASLSMGFSRQEYWSGQPFPPPGDLPNLGIESRSSTCRQFYRLGHQENPFLLKQKGIENLCRSSTKAIQNHLIIFLFYKLLQQIFNFQLCRIVDICFNFLNFLLMCLFGLPS